MKNLFLLSVIFSSVFLQSCKKEGCTNQDSINYDSSAKSDDGSCKYESTVVFWYGEATSDSLINDQATSLTYVVNGETIGSTGTNVFWTASPDCEQTGVTSKVVDLSDNTSGSISYTVKDATGFIYWQETITINANKCEGIELVW